jgi:hypothetical protein
MRVQNTPSGRTPFRGQDARAPRKEIPQRGIAATKGTGSNQQSNCHKKHKKSLFAYVCLPGAYKRCEPGFGKI